jgi:ArsR family transcriptional regulator
MAQATGSMFALQLKALADETRLAILECLGSDECCVCELMDTLELPQSLLSFHLGVLRRAGLVKDRRDGRWSYYVIDEHALRAVAAAVDELATRRAPRKRRRC